MKDEIIAEVRRNRDRLAAAYGHNLDAIVAAIRKRERNPLTGIVQRGERKSNRAKARTPAIASQLSERARP